MGFIGAIDESPRTVFADPTASRAAFNLMRIRRDVGRGSTVGSCCTRTGLSPTAASTTVSPPRTHGS